MIELDLSKFIGRWKLESSDNFDEYLKVVGLGKIARLAACNTAVTQDIGLEGKNVVVKSKSVFKNYDIYFVLDEEFDETTVDGRNFRSKVYVENDRLVHHQMPIDKENVASFIYRWIEDDKLHVLLVAKGVECHRVFRRIA